MTLRIMPWECIPERWFVTGILVSGNANGDEYRFAVLRLPSYRMGTSLYHQKPEWQQLAIFYHGRDGFSLEWLPAPLTAQ